MKHDIGIYRIETDNMQFILKRKITPVGVNEEVVEDGKEDKYRTIGHYSTLDSILTAIVNKIIYDSDDLKDIVKELNKANKNIIDIRKALDSIGKEDK